MYYVFPLLVYRQNALGLDFSTVRTWVVFDAKDKTPCGAISWRIRRHAVADMIVGHLPVSLTDGSGMPQPVAEVLFIAVFEENRNVECGSDLVDAVVTEARKCGVRQLYVEIGEAQARAQDFWGKHAFEKIDRQAPAATRVSRAQLRFFDSVCFRFADTDQYIKHLD
jgi:ribosomal protein S18 acetylase RimI-like enzyme